MILGIGSDLCDIRRIEQTLDKFGDRFIARSESGGYTRSGQSVTQTDFVVTTGTFVEGTVRDAA